jgi:TatD DNase family protein
MRLVDVHCHLESREFDGILDKILTDAATAGIIKLITSSIVPDQWRLSLDLSGSHDEIECALGIHPWYIQHEYKNEISKLDDYLDRGAIAVGEIGLDAKTNKTDLSLQIDFFEDQLALAKEKNLPIIMHCRGAFQEAILSIKRVGVSGRGGLIHSFSGSAEIAEQFKKYGFSFSLGGILTYRNSAKRNKLMKYIYPDNFLLETDSPDISPIEKKERPNVPANILYNLKAASEILELDIDSVAEKTTKNALKLFNLRI